MFATAEIAEKGNMHKNAHLKYVNDVVNHWRDRCVKVIKCAHKHTDGGYKNKKVLYTALCYLVIKV